MEKPFSSGGPSRGAHSSYEESFLAVCKVMGLPLEELKNWDCCSSVTRRTEAPRALEVLFSHVGVENLSARVTHSLDGLKVAPFYGCRAVGPGCGFDDAGDPVSMDELLEVIGADVIGFPSKTVCCGGCLGKKPPQGEDNLLSKLMREVSERSAQVIATCCSLCQSQLETYQAKSVDDAEKQVPVVYFTQLIGLALGLDYRKVGLHRHRISPDKIMAWSSDA